MEGFRAQGDDIECICDMATLMGTIALREYLTENAAVDYVEWSRVMVAFSGKSYWIRSL
jgi:hypothetical protein